MNVMLSRRVPYTERPLRLPHTVMAEHLTNELLTSATAATKPRRMSFTRQDWKAAIVIQKICRGKIGKMRAAFRKERNNAIVQKEILHQEKMKLDNIDNHQNSRFLAKKIIVIPKHLWKMSSMHCHSIVIQ